MKAKSLVFAAMFYLLLPMSSWAVLLPGESIKRDPITGDYTATYWYEDETGGEFRTASLKAATKVEPTLTSFLKRMEDGQIRYAYKLANGKAAKQPIERFQFFGLPANSPIAGSTTITEGNNRMDLFDSAITSPNKNWYGWGNKSSELRIGWYYQRENYDASLGIQPRAALSGFSFTSLALPGVAIAQVMGNNGYSQFDNSTECGPETSICDEMTAVERSNFLPRNAAAPMISVPVPFNSAVVLDRIHTHILTWQSRHLIDSIYFTQLDRYLVAAAEAFRHNQSKVGREHLEMVRELLKKEHPDLERSDEARDDHDERKNTTRFTIDRLAARVLDFDVKYVLERSEYNEGHR